jgi:curved DNA-binding protein CbpA
MGDRSHYDVLGVTARATPDEVRAAYRRAARDHHPDAGGDAQRMSDLNVAWHVLGDPVRRAAYDRQLARRPAAGHGFVAPAAPFASRGEGGAWDVDADVYRTAEEWADLADARPLGQTRALEGWWAILPPAMLVAALALFFGAFIFRAPALLSLSGGTLVLALGLFVLAPLRAMSRKDPG